MECVHNRLYCVKEHFFLQASHEDIQLICHNTFVQCSSGIRKCHKSWNVIARVHCVLTSGIMMSFCEYTGRDGSLSLVNGEIMLEKLFLIL